MELEEIKDRMIKNCHTTEFVDFFFGEAQRMIGFTAAFDEFPERRAFCLGIPNAEFAVIILALEVISSEMPVQKKKALELLAEMKKREVEIKQVFQLKN